ncbi:hypothetical protein QN277_024172 [Acacia crassicarpa]|uniref:Reverse transcriptase Ty1/copia-type domain-containing protein n=1 Tax=Acacia crassicarpa TaxID=499986 RepID=A0AAE1MNR5_9FABA|nr:hypothetical protein QN277_024172 [Acacia crassicarpa]
MTNDDLGEEEPKRNTRQRTSTFFGPNFLTYLLDNDSRTYGEAMGSLEAPFWEKTINGEVESILSNHTWKLVDFPPGNKPLRTKWIFKKKMKAGVTIEKYKARLVVKGYRQREGLDYFDTYSPVTKIISIRMLIALAALNGLEESFLNGELEEEIYLEQPEGFVVSGQK